MQMINRVGDEKLCEKVSVTGRESESFERSAPCKLSACFELF